MSKKKKTFEDRIKKYSDEKLFEMRYFKSIALKKKMGDCDAGLKRTEACGGNLKQVNANGEQARDAHILEKEMELKKNRDGVEETEEQSQERLRGQLASLNGEIKSRRLEQQPTLKF